MKFSAPTTKIPKDQRALASTQALTALSEIDARLAPAYAWGREQLWTHFDGYRVTRGLRLHALVGGNARYGGLDDFCAVQRDYGPPPIIARFCVLRRERFLARERWEPEDAEAGG